MGDGRDFGARPRWQRFLVYVAGPVANGVLTVAVLSALYMIGFQVDASLFDRPIVGAVDPRSPAQAAGIAPGDEIVAIDGKPQRSWEDAQYAILIRPDATIELRVRRAGVERAVSLKAGADGVEKVGTIGVHPLVRIGAVLPGSAAESAGLRPDDAILSIDDKPVRSFLEIPPVVAAAEGKPLRLGLWRDGELREVEVTPLDKGEGPRIGIGPKTIARKLGLVAALREAVRWSWGMTQQTFEILGRLLRRQISPKTMMGPLGIAKASGDAARGGLGALFYLVAVISLQVGIMNLFPLPPLDGGHLAILAGESLIRRDFSVELKAWIMNAGAMALFLLIGLVLYSDLSKTSWLSKYLP
jgi:regulator of sigma E protease